MADFDDFENPAPQQSEDDPAADFLAREQDELKGLEDDNFGGENAGGNRSSHYQIMTHFLVKICRSLPLN
jgi:hypothetical protein